MAVLHEEIPSSAALLEVMRAHPEGLSEYDLFGELASRGQEAFGPRAFADKLSLFQSHFLLFHSLYALRERLRRTGQGDLELGCLRIALRPPAAVTDTALEHPDPLRAYYGDLENLRSTGREEVEQMLEAFWQCFASQRRQKEALAVLGLPADADPTRVKQRYHRLAFEHHPDRGGDAEALNEINAAMQVLKAAGR